MTKRKNRRKSIVTKKHGSKRSTVLALKEVPHKVFVDLTVVPAGIWASAGAAGVPIPLYLLNIVRAAAHLMAKGTTIDLIPEEAYGTTEEKERAAPGNIDELKKYLDRIIQCAKEEYPSVHGGWEPAPTPEKSERQIGNIWFYRPSGLALVFHVVRKHNGSTVRVEEVFGIGVHECPMFSVTYALEVRAVEV